MKTCLLALLALPTGIAFGQIPGHFSPRTSPWVNVPTIRVQKRFLPPPAPPTEGFWVIEENPKCRAIVHFHADSRQELYADTLRQRHLKLESRAIVEWLNERLAGLLDDQKTSAVIFRQL